MRFQRAVALGSPEATLRRGEGFHAVEDVIDGGEQLGPTLPAQAEDFSDKAEPGR